LKTIFLAIFILCLSVIFLTEVSRKEMRYDCRMATYPYAVDVPKRVVDQCAEMMRAQNEK
jgi:hypothetical protein